MKYFLLVAESANEDAIVIFDWYEEKLNGLEDRFINELVIAKIDLLNNPLAFATWKKSKKKIIINDTVVRALQLHFHLHAF